MSTVLLDRTNGCVSRSDSSVHDAPGLSMLNLSTYTRSLAHPPLVITRRLLDAFDNNQWKAYQLRDAVSLKPSSASDLLRYNQDPSAPVGDGFTVDPQDKDRSDLELKAFKVSTRNRIHSVIACQRR